MYILVSVFSCSNYFTSSEPFYGGCVTYSLENKQPMSRIVFISTNTNNPHTTCLDTHIHTSCSVVEIPPELNKKYCYSFSVPYRDELRVFGFKLDYSFVMSDVLSRLVIAFAGRCLHLLFVSSLYAGVLLIGSNWIGKPGFNTSLDLG